MPTNDTTQLNYKTISWSKNMNCTISSVSEDNGSAKLNGTTTRRSRAEQQIVVILLALGCPQLYRGNHEIWGATVQLNLLLLDCPCHDRAGVRFQAQSRPSPRGVKRSEREAHRSPPPSTEVKNAGVTPPQSRSLSTAECKVKLFL
jgi:hypothetical protein